MKRIFICSRYRGRVDLNREKARKYARQIIEAGYIPVVPHLLYPQFLDDLNPEERMLGITLGIEDLRECSEIWIFGTMISEGMQFEMSKAVELGIPAKLFDDNGRRINPETMELDERTSGKYRSAVSKLTFAK